MASLQEKRQKVLQFKGAVSAVITPYDANGEVNVSVIPGYVKFMVDNHINGAYIIGTTGEGYNLTNEEKFSIAQAWKNEIDRQNADILTIVNITSMCVKEAVQLSRQCEALGIDAIAVLPPIYYRPSSVKDLVNYLSVFGNAAPNTPLLYYHIPSMTGELPFDIVDVVREGLKQIPQLTAMKYTDTNVTRFSILQKNFRSNFKIFCGFDECLLSSLVAVECNAAVCALFNLPNIVQSFHKIVADVERNDFQAARQEQYKIVDACLLHKNSGNFFLSIKTTFNSLVKPLGLNFGLPRPPIAYEYNF